MAVIFLLSSLSLETLQATGITLGSWIHVPLYAGLGGVLYWALLKEQVLLRLGYAWTLGSLFAVCDEVHQNYVPGREFSMTDIDLDLLGLAIGIIVVILFRKGKTVLEQYSTRGAK
jgi:VanZ family protein